MSQLKILALPRDPGPYQELLYQPMRARGVRVEYFGRPTPSQTLNLVLRPLELLIRRTQGYRILHIHWLYDFLSFPIATRLPTARRAYRAWLGLNLWVAVRLGYKIVWTAHNVLPHAPIFDDDAAARRALVSRCSLVIAHSAHALRELERLGAGPRQSEVIPIGPVAPHSVFALEPPTGESLPRRVLCFGRVAEYKGIEDLLDVLQGVSVPLEVLVAGACTDQALRRRLVQARSALGDNVRLMLESVSDAALPELLNGADALAFPFRRITTSGSVTLGLAAGRPAIVPDLPAFADLPDDAVIRYPRGHAGLRDALIKVAEMPAEEFRRRGHAAREAISSPGWEEIARRTMAVLGRLDTSRPPDTLTASEEPFRLSGT